jgi:hypothetical protein
VSGVLPSIFFCNLVGFPKVTISRISNCVRELLILEVALLLCSLASLTEVKLDVRQPERGTRDSQSGPARHPHKPQGKTTVTGVTQVRIRQGGAIQGEVK